MSLKSLFISKKRLQKQFDRKNIEIIKKSPLFDEQWYLEQYQDVAQSGMDASEHYYFFGGYENRGPSNLFSSKSYYENNPDVMFQQFNPLLHYELYGRTEKRTIKPSTHDNNKKKLNNHAEVNFILKYLHIPLAYDFRTFKVTINIQKFKKFLSIQNEFVIYQLYSHKLYNKQNDAYLYGLIANHFGFSGNFSCNIPRIAKEFNTCNVCLY